MAMLIMTVGLLGLLQAVQTAYRQSQRDRVREEAVLVAEEQMHNWRRLNYDNITGGAKTDERLRTIGGGSRSFTVIRQNDEMAGGSGPAKKLRVAVTWSLRGDSLSHEIYTLKTR